MTETRTLYDSPNYMRNHDATKVTQTAIPWCTTHDSKAYVRIDELSACERAEAYGWNDSCNISLGGYDHLWWKDVT